MELSQELATLVSQFGVAGLIGWMWLSERRQSSKRDAQLTEAHESMREQRVALGQLMRVVEDNTRALSALEASQRAMVEALAQRAS